jgi:hypothetical protein
VQVSTVRLLAVLMGATHAVVWVVGSRWERPGRTVRLRASLRRPPVAARGGYVALAVPLLYPVGAIIAPGWSYDGPLNWSSRVDAACKAPAWDLGRRAWSYWSGRPRSWGAT